MVYAVKDMDDFNNQLAAAGGKLVVVDFHATWCGPCKMIAPHMEEMSKTMEEVVFLKVDVDDCEDIAAQYNVIKSYCEYIKMKVTFLDHRHAHLPLHQEQVQGG